MCKGSIDVEGYIGIVQRQIRSLYFSSFLCESASTAKDEIFTSSQFRI